MLGVDCFNLYLIIYTKTQYVKNLVFHTYQQGFQYFFKGFQQVFTPIVKKMDYFCITYEK